MGRFEDNLGADLRILPEGDSRHGGPGKGHVGKEAAVHFNSEVLKPRRQPSVPSVPCPLEESLRNEFQRARGTALHRG
jgi:hypothetical protein